MDNKKTLDLSDWTEIIIETNEENPRPLVRMTAEDPFEILENFVQIRATPKYD